MNLELDDENLYINLNPLEMLLSLHGSLTVPLENIYLASTEKPIWEMATRAPGINIPFLIKGGTFYASGGREFWVTHVGRPWLVIETEDWNYKKVVLTVGNNRLWAERINSAVASAT